MNPNCRFSRVLLGDEVPWTAKNDAVIKRETIKLFVSHAHADKNVVAEIVKIIKARLEREIRPYEIWWDAESMQAGQEVHDQIMKAVQESDFLILMASPNSMRSQYVQLEWKKKRFDPFYSKTSSSNRILPVFIEGLSPSALPDFLRDIYGFSYSGPDDAWNIEKLVEQIFERHQKIN
jgi:hypothetical protein